MFAGRRFVAFYLFATSHIIALTLPSWFCGGAIADDATPTFVRGLNLNGPPVVIDGNAWEGRDAAWYACSDNAFESQQVELLPATDDARAMMIRSSRWGGNRVELTGLANGVYTLFLYVWEDNNPEAYSLSVNGREVLPAYNSGRQGQWARLGPWITSPTDGKIIISSRGGAANFSGIELWSGRYDGIQQAISDEELAFFEKRVRPVLVERCYACHSQGSEELGGDLLVDSRATLQRGGSSGPAVVPGDPDRSLLVQAIRYDDLEMPPDAKLSDQEIKDLERWVKIGAPDPRATATTHLGKQIDIEAARQFWSLRPLEQPPIPAVHDKGWPLHPIDNYILAEQEQRGLRPTEPADKRTLIRRATYDLHGLPPTPEEIDEFLTDTSPDAFARVVDRLLESPRYGERWGRHWLDVVRYADTAGDNSDFPIPQIHRYRDWVIQAFNSDIPYDDFIRYQVAGDLLGGETEEERQQRLIATGYLANARRFGSRVDDYPWHLTIEDTIDNLGRAFLGMSISCARCHDHKFDPITARDYYGLYGVFASTRYPWPGIELDQKQRDFVPLVSAEQWTVLEQQLKARSERQADLQGVVKKLKTQVDKASADEKPALAMQLKEAEKAAQEFANQPPLFETAYAVAESEQRQDVMLQIKGDPSKPGDLVRRHFPEVLGGSELPDDCRESGRRELAEWLVSDQNPLPARVIANRIWHYHFGRGLVPTPNDFGKQGKPPTHPALLDYLALQLRKGGWSLKALHRQIMLSRTYQQSSFRNPEAVAADPANDWLAGFRRQRLDAESIRDTLLVLARNIDWNPAEPHPFPPQSAWDFTQHRPFKAVYESNHRSVYLMTQRIQRHPFLATFDGADPSTSTGARMSSTTPLQALFLLNDPFVHEQSLLITHRVLQAASSPEERVDYAHRLLFARPATTEDVAAAIAFIDKATTVIALSADSTQLSRDSSRANGLPEPSSSADQISQGERLAWHAYLRSLLRVNEFVYID